VADTIESLKIAIELETAQLKTQLNQVTTQVESMGKNVAGQSGNVKKLGGAFEGVAGSIKKLLGAAAVIAFLNDSAKAAVEDQQSQALLARQMEVTTGANAKQKAAVEAQIGALEEMSGVADDKIRPSFATLLRATHDSTEAMKLQKLAMDISAGTGRDLESVSLALAKAQGGNTMALNKMVPGLKNSKDLMGDLQKQFKGAAKTAADANPYARLGVAFDRLKETLGKALLPILTSLTKILLPLMPIVNMLAKVISVLVKAIMPVVVAIVKALMPAFNAIVKVVLVLVQAILPPLLKILNKVLLPIIKMLSEIIIKYLVPYFMKLIEVLTPLVNLIGDYIVGAFQNLMKVVGPIWENLLKPIIDSLMALMGIKVEPTIAPQYDDSGMGDFAGVGAIADIGSGEFDLGAGDGGGGGGGAKAETTAQKVQKIMRTYRQGVVKETKELNDNLAKLQAEHTSKIAEITKSGQEKLSGIVQSSMDLLRNAFADVTKIDAGNMFISAGANVTAFISMLRDKLTGAKRLAQDAAALAGAGYSQEFIDSIVAQGPLIGDQLTQQLLAAGPEQAQLVQDLFAQVQTESAHGVDSLAREIYNKSGLATEQLKNAYVTAQSELVTALKDENDAYATSTAQLQTKYEAAMAKLKTTRMNALKDLGLSGTGAIVTPPVTPTLTSTPTPTAVTVTPTTVINTNVVAQTHATPEQIATAITNGIKFGTPIKSAPLTPDLLNKWITQTPTIPASPTH